MSIYRRLNPRLLVQVGDLSSHIVGVGLNLLMKPKMIVSRRPHQGLDEVMFPYKDERERHQSGVSQWFFDN